MGNWIRLFTNAACAIGASGVAGPAAGLAAVQLIVREAEPAQPRERAPASARRGLPGPRRPRMLPCPTEMQASFRELPLSS